MRRWLGNWWPLLLIVLIVVAAGWLLVTVWWSPHRSELAIYGAFAVPVVLAAAGWVAWAWGRAAVSPVEGAWEAALDRAADRLAAAVRAQWEAAATGRGLAGADPVQVTWGRPSMPVAGPAAAAVVSRRFSPLHGLAPVGRPQMAGGDLKDLHAVYGGLGSGRLVIAGPPGSGKSGAAILLILAALRHRALVPGPNRPGVPVPVLITAGGWDPRSQPVSAWLTRRLQETYPLFDGRTGASTAAGLLAVGKIAVIIDGFDEIPEDLRPDALRALSQQATFRLVVLSRTAEIATAAEHDTLQGAAAIELRPVGPGEAAAFLGRVHLDPPPTGWRDLISRLRADPDGLLAAALDNPLALTLVRDTYQDGDDAREFLDYCDRVAGASPTDQALKAITDHLLDRVLPAAYAHRPGQPSPRYDLDTARNALAKIATRLNHDHTRDLTWWTIPAWLSQTPLAVRLMVGLTATLTLGLPLGLTAGLATGLTSGLTDGLTIGLTITPMIGLTFGMSRRIAARYGPGKASLPEKLSKPGKLSKPQLRRVLTGRAPINTVAPGLVLGLAFGLPAGLAFGLPAGLAFGLAGGVTAGLVRAFVAESESAVALSPTASRRADRNYSLAIGLVFGLVVGLAGVLLPGFGLTTGIAAYFVFGIVAGLASIFATNFIASKTVTASVASLLIAAKWGTPLRLMTFLDDASKRNVLRTVGPVYQFRHARLQDRLASTIADTKRSTPG